MAIQHKDCPRCGTTVGNYITRCECGFSFDELDDTDPTQRLEAMAEEERLYEDYLAARAKQAISDAAGARSGALKDPGNYYWATRVEQTEAVRDAVMAELYQQKLRNSEISAAIEEAKSFSKKRLRAVHPVAPRLQALPQVVPPQTSRTSDEKPAATGAAKHQPPALPSQTDLVAAAARSGGLTAPPVLLNQTQVTEAAFVLELSAAKTSTDTGETRTYTAKLEEILSTTKRTTTSSPDISATAHMPGHEALQTSQLAAAVKKAASLLAAIDAVPVAMKNVSDNPPSTLRPEDRLEHDSKAIRVRAVAMAERLFGKADTPMQAARILTHEGQVNPAAAGSDALITDVIADRPNPLDSSPTPSSPPAVETVIAAVAVKAKQPQRAARTEPPIQVHAKHPPRNTHTRRTKTTQTRPADNLPALPAPEPYIEDRPSATFRALQAAKAEKIVQESRAANKIETKHCPFCSAVHAGQAERCGCGYTFEKPIELPVLVLSSKERNELLDDGILIRRPKPPR